MVVVILGLKLSFLEGSRRQLRRDSLNDGRVPLSLGFGLLIITVATLFGFLVINI